MDTAAFVKKSRAKLGLTQAQFAKILGVTGITVYRWEASIRGLPMPTQHLIELKVKEARNGKRIPG